MKSIKNRLVESVERLGWILAPLTNNTAFLGHLTALIAAIMVMVGCSTVRYVPVEGKTEVKTHYVDSVRWNVRDSVVLIERSVFKDYAGLLDTLRLEGASGTVACAWNDTSRHILNGTLEERPRVLREIKTEYRDRIVERRDSIYFEKPVPYEVERVVTKTPKWAFISAAINLLIILCIGLRIFLKLQIGR